MVRFTFTSKILNKHSESYSITPWKRIITIIGLLTILSFFGFNVHESKAFSANQYVDGNNLSIHSFQISLKERSAFRPFKFEFESEFEVNVYIVNETELSHLAAGESFQSAQNWTDVTTIRETYTFDELSSEMEHVGIITIRENGEVIDVLADLNFVVVNEGGRSTQYVLNFYAWNQLYDFVHKFSYHLVVLAFSWLGFQLIIDGLKEKKDEEDLQASIYIKYGFGFLMGSLATASWEVYNWYKVYHPREDLNPSLAFKDMPFEAIAGNLLTFLTFLCLGLSILFISWTVERDVQQKKIPYLTIALIVAEVFMAIGIVVISILPVVIVLWLIAMILSLINVLGAYLKIILNTQGQIRKKVSFIFIGLLGTFGCIGLRDFFEVNFMFNFAGAIFILVLYRGIAKIK